MMTDIDLTDNEFHYPNKMGRIILLSLEEVLGRNGINAVLKMGGLTHLINNFPPNTFDLCFPFNNVGKIHDTMDILYGPHSGRGLALRAGRACFTHGLREFGDILGLTDLAFRLLPLKMKLRTGAEAFAEIFNRYSDQIVHLEDKPDKIWLHIERCPVCWGRHTDSPCCHMLVGLLQESLFWVSGGKHFIVEEVSCIGQGDSTCTFEVNRQPIE
jgi:predicted hydrocarbon binding protein